jgi:DNA helicase IV
VPLLDEAHALLGPKPRRRRSGQPPVDDDVRTYGHIVVDEAQDLTPMQLRMVARRARDGAFTVLGDVAQATGPVRYSSWGEVLPHLPRGDEANVEELRHAYRVPREIIELALPLLEDIAPDVAPPSAYRTGAAPPEIRHVDEAQLLIDAFRAAAAAPDGLPAVIVPEELAENVPSGDLVPVLTPREAKGLEFDHVIVVEPALIPPRDLYVALTRPTKTLVVLHARDLPRQLR